MSTSLAKKSTIRISESDTTNDSYQNVLLLNAIDDHEDEYDDCKDLEDDLGYNRNKSNSLRNINNEASKGKTKRDASINSKQESYKYSRNPNSPMKRNKDSQRTNDCEEESPKKRYKMPNLSSANENRPSVRGFNLASSVLTRDLSPKSNSRSTSMCETGNKKNTFASTPKSERRSQKSRVKELAERNSANVSAAVERNMSNNWGDILEELEEQNKELNDYVEKVSIKFKLEKEVLIKNLETDAEKLRKRQKHINFGKVTPEYQRYILEISRKNRQAYHPKTPNKFRKCSRRKFDGAIKKWRKLLHAWDENPDCLQYYKHSMEDEEDTEDFGGAISYIVDDYDLLDDEELAHQHSDTK